MVEWLDYGWSFGDVIDPVFEMSDNAEQCVISLRFFWTARSSMSCLTGFGDLIDPSRDAQEMMSAFSNQE